jgi:hypothetical protein
MNPGVLRSYQYLVCLVAIHMVVLGAANVLRVIAEVALGATSGGFTGLPFLFAEGRGRPGEISREQLSLAIALLLVGGPAWAVHWRAAERAIARDAAERASPLRSFYLHLVIFVTALLVFGYAQGALGLALRELFIPEQIAPFAGPHEPEWPARLAGALAMVVAAAAAWSFHSWRSARDRALLHIAGPAATWRRLAMYALMVIGLFTFISALVSASTSLVADVFGLGAGQESPFFQGGVSRELMRRATLVSAVPPLLAGVALWLLYRWRTDRIAAASTAEGAAERASVARKLFLYFVVLALGVQALFAATSIGTQLLEPLLGRISAEPLPLLLTFALPPAVIFAAAWLAHWIQGGREALRDREYPVQARVRRTYLYLALAISAAVVLVASGLTLHQLAKRLLDQASVPLLFPLAGPLSFALVFGAAWLFHWLVAEREVAEEPEDAVQADARRAYLYLVLLVTLAAAAIGAAGTLGVIGSYVLGDQTHSPDEIALYLTLLVVGSAPWAFHWSVAQRYVRESVAVAATALSEIRDRTRRSSLALATFGGVVGALVFGSAAIFRIINALLAQEFTTAVAHDLWHLLSDLSVSVAVALFHWLALRRDRATLAAMPAVAAPPTPLVAPPVPARAPVQSSPRAWPTPAAPQSAGPALEPPTRPPPPRPLVLVITSPGPATRARLLEAVERSENARVFDADETTASEIVRRLASAPEEPSATESGQPEIRLTEPRPADGVPPS